MVQPPMSYPIIPVNMKDLRQLQGHDVEIPVPSIEHTLIKCGRCGGDGWIGPGQLMQYTFNGGIIRCYWCLFDYLNRYPQDVELRAMDATADSKPRRTT